MAGKSRPPRLRAPGPRQDDAPPREAPPRTRRPPGRVHTELDKTAEAAPDSGLQLRRVFFFLLPHDRDSEPEGPYQAGTSGEAVDPRTIAPRRVGEKTPRSQRGSAAITAAGR